MSLKDLQLPTFVITDLYTTDLIESVDFVEQKPALTTPEVANNSIRKIKFLGENKKNISLIVNENDALHLTEDKLAFLTKILGACKLNLADVSIVNISNKSILYSDVKEELNCQSLILFGVDAKDFKLPLIFPEYKIQHFSYCKMLIAKELNSYTGTNEIAVAEKRKLWESLKSMFELN